MGKEQLKELLVTWIFAYFDEHIANPRHEKYRYNKFEKGDWVIEMSVLRRQPKRFSEGIFKLDKTPIKKDEFEGTTIKNKKIRWENAYCYRLPVPVEKTLNEILSRTQTLTG